MEGDGSIAWHGADSDRGTFKGILLTVLVAVFFSGAPYLLSFFHRSLTWVLWATMIWIIYRSSRELPFWRLARPALPYLLWLVFYMIWALIVSPAPQIGYAGKTMVTIIIFMAAMVILTASSHSLRTLANLIQFVVVANLILWLLMAWSPRIAQLVMVANDPRYPELFAVVDRFGGLYGNGNMVGYVCIVAVALSTLAMPWIAWLGRMSCLPLLYLTASRKALILFLVILFLYVLIVQGRNIRFWVASAAVVVVSLAFGFFISEGLRGGNAGMSDDPKMARLLDVQEKQTKERGGETRVDLFQHWVTALIKAPWYGYGLRAMSGRVYDTTYPNKVVVRGPYRYGAHNTYLGVWVETGPVGFMTFVLVLLHYVRRCLSARTNPSSKWAIISLMLVNLTFLFVSHDHLFCFEGEIAFALLFLLPTSPGLQRMGRWRTSPA